MRKIIFILLLLSTCIGFSQENYTKITKENKSIKSTDKGLNIGNSKGFKPSLIHSWSIPNSENENTAKALVSSLSTKLTEYGFKAGDFQFKGNTLFFSVKIVTEIPAEKFTQVCSEVGFTYLKIEERIKFINAK